MLPAFLKRNNHSSTHHIFHILLFLSLLLRAAFNPFNHPTSSKVMLSLQAKHILIPPQGIMFSQTPLCAVKMPLSYRLWSLREILRCLKRLEEEKEAEEDDNRRFIFEA